VVEDMIRNRTKVSKFLSYLLRHGPKKFGLDTDRYGFADFDKVFRILTERFPGIEKKDVNDLVESDSNKRFEIKGGRIRARYGHSIEIEPGEECLNVPDVLFHGTSPKSLDSILKEGLKPGRRKFVHLSLSVEEAMRVGRRKDIKPLILKIDAKRANIDSLKFWKEENIHLTEEIPPQYISVHK
jgi:putative RNA 2'-phosphotransferase